MRMRKSHLWHAMKLFLNQLKLYLNKSVSGMKNYSKEQFVQRENMNLVGIDGDTGNERERA